MLTNFGNAKRPVGVVTVAPWNFKKNKKGIDNPKGLWYNIIKKRVATIAKKKGK